MQPPSPPRDRLAGSLAAAGMEPLPSVGNFLLVHHGADDEALIGGLLRHGILVRSGGSSGCRAGCASPRARSR